MEAKIDSIRENTLMERKEIEVVLDHEGEATPSVEDVKSRLAAENNLDTENIEVESIRTGFGRQVSVAKVRITEEFEYDEELEEETEERLEEEEVEKEEATGGADYDDVVSGTITEAKEKLGDLDDPNFEAALEAEKDNKNRKTLIEWLEAQ